MAPPFRWRPAGSARRPLATTAPRLSFPMRAPSPEGSDPGRAGSFGSLTRPPLRSDPSRRQTHHDRRGNWPCLVTVVLAPCPRSKVPPLPALRRADMARLRVPAELARLSSPCMMIGTLTTTTRLERSGPARFPPRRSPSQVRREATHDSVASEPKNSTRFTSEVCRGFVQPRARHAEPVRAVPTFPRPPTRLTNGWNGGMPASRSV